MKNSNIVAISFFAFAVLLGFFLEQVVRFVWRYTGWADAELLGPEWTVTTLIAFGVAFVAVLATWMNAGAREYTFEVASEIKKVTWPSMDETKAATWAVIAVSVVVAGVLGVFDFFWKAVTDLAY